MKYSIEYTDDLPEKFGGYVELPSIIMRVLGDTPTIKIRPKYENDKGLLAHEVKHVEQYSKSIFHNIMYRFSKNYRYKCELEAYKEQIINYNYGILSECLWIIGSLYTKYNLSIDRGVVIDGIPKILQESKSNVKMV